MTSTLPPVETPDLEAVPEQYRRLIARWLTERARELGAGADTSWIFPKETVEFGAQCLYSAAADLLCPTDELGVDDANRALIALMTEPACPARSPESDTPCVLADTPDAHHRGHESARQGGFNVSWATTVDDQKRWQR